MGETKGKFDGIETLRALACFMVIVLHCAPFSTESATSAETSLLVYIALSRAAVPLFFMITGYLLLDRDEDIFLFYKKRLLRIAAPLLFYSIFYNTVSACLSGEPIRLTAIAAAIVHPYVHLWFMYILIGVYLFMPFMRRMFNNATDAERAVFTGIWFLLFLAVPSFFPSADVNAIQREFGLNQFAGHMGFVFVGGWLRRVKANPARAAFVGYLCSVILILAFTWLYTSLIGPKGYVFVGNRSPFAFAAALSLFLAIRHMPLIRFRGLVLEIARCSFGIYLVHMIYVMILFKIGLYSALPSPWVAIPLCACIVFIASFATIKIAGKIPYLRRVAG